ncbi:MAG: hypothetical protein L6408_02610 [Nanoarchaeota archaeon]|nr:hypothetical protein [Nanoarchaeota archaeon]
MGKLLKKQIDEIYSMLDNNYTNKEIMIKVGCSKPTLYKYVDLRKKEKKESPGPADVVEKTDTQIIKEGFVLAKDVAILGVKLESTKDWLENITDTTEDDDNNIIGLLEQVSYLETKIDDKNITLELLKEYQGLRNDIIIDGNKIIKGINERMRREEREEMARIEREKKEKIEREKKEAEERRINAIERMTERYYSVSLYERRRRILKQGGVKEEDIRWLSDELAIDEIREIGEKGEKFNDDDFVEILKGYLSSLSYPINNNFIIYWFKRVGLYRCEYEVGK